MAKVCKGCVHYPKDGMYCIYSETYISRRFMPCAALRKEKKDVLPMSSVRPADESSRRYVAVWEL